MPISAILKNDCQSSSIKYILNTIKRAPTLATANLTRKTKSKRKDNVLEALKIIERDVQLPIALIIADFK